MTAKEKFIERATQRLLIVFCFVRRSRIPRAVLNRDTFVYFQLIASKPFHSELFDTTRKDERKPPLCECKPSDLDSSLALVEIAYWGH